MLSRIKERMREISPNKSGGDAEEDDFNLPKRAYYDLWGHTKKEFLSLKISLLVLGLVTVLSIVFTLTTVNSLNEKLQLRPVIAVPGAEAPGLYKPGRLPPIVVWDLGRRFSVQYLNFDASRGKAMETVSSAMSETRYYLSFSGKEDLQDIFEQIIMKAIQNKETVSFVPLSSAKKTVKVLPNGKRLVVVRGVYKKYVAKTEVENKIIDIEITMSQVPATDSNPYGLEVDSYKLKEIAGE